MTRLHVLAIALGGGVLAAPSFVQAQSGDAIARAENTCLDDGVTLRTTAFEICVDRAARAFDRGSPNVARLEARLATDASDTCLAYGLEPRSLGYQRCVSEEMDRRTDRALSVSYVPARPAYDGWGYVID